MELSKDPVSLETSLETTFGGLSLNEDVYNDHIISEASTDDESPIFELYKRYTAFAGPHYYRVINSDSPPAGRNGDLHPRLYPTPRLQHLTQDELRWYINRHAYRYNMYETPFISLTSDLLRAFQIAFVTYSQQQDVTILLICPSKLRPGSYIPCNELRGMCGLPEEPIYNTEILVWWHVPAESIIHRWSRSQLLQSGLVDVFPTLGRIDQTMKLESLRWSFQEDLQKHKKDDRTKFFASKTAETLVGLGMDPSSVRPKQIFLFLLGRADGFPVERRFDDAEEWIVEKFRDVIEEFDQALHKMTVSEFEVCRLRRESEFNELEAKKRTDCDSPGFRRWLKRQTWD